jgi:hypothetical protein
MTPIPVQGALHYFKSEGPERDGFSQVLQSFGVENYQYRAQAEKLIADGMMPDLDRVLDIVSQIRTKYQPKILEARRQAGIHVVGKKL